MNIFSTYNKGIQNTWYNKKVVGLIYASNLLMGLFFMLPLAATLEACFGNSMEYEKLLYRFDFTILRDYLNQHGASFFAVLSQVKWYLLFFLLWSVFLNGGTVVALLQNQSAPTDSTQKRISFGDFWKACASCFPAFLRLSLVSLLAYLLAIALVLLPAFVLFRNLSDTLACTMPYINGGIITLLLIALLLSILVMIFDYAKVYIVQTGEQKAFVAFKKAFGFVRKHFFTTYPLYLLGALVILVIFFGINFIENIVSPSTVVTILIALVLQQLFVVLRIGARVTNMAAAWELLKRRR